MHPFLSRLALGSTLGVLVAATGCDPTASCKNSACANGLYCEPVTKLCVANGAPKIAFDLPANDALLVGSTVRVVGRVTDEEAIPTNSVEVQIDHGAWNVLPLSSTGVFASELPLPAADRRQIRIEARATDVHGAVGNAVPLTPAVDNVGPSFTITPVNDTILGAAVAVVTFTEPVQEAQGVPLISISSGPVGKWNADGTQMSFLPLDFDRSYLLTVPGGAVVDLAGNPSGAAATSGFRVAPKAPTTSTLDLGGTVSDFEAWSDAGGHVAIAARVTPSAGGDQLVFARFDPKLGSLAVLDRVSSFTTGSTFRASQGVHDTGGGHAVELAGVAYTLAGGPSSGRSKRDELALSVQTGSLLSVPYPAGCGEGGDAPDEGAFVVDKGAGQLAVRRGTTDRLLPAGFTPTWVTGRSANDYQLLALAGTDLKAVAHACTCSPTPASCSDDAAPKVVASGVTSDVTAATTQTGLRLYTYQDTTKTQWRAQCSSCPSCSTSYLIPVAVASEGVGDKVLFARKQATSIEVLSRDLGLKVDCSDEGTIVGTVPNVSGAKKFRPLLAGGKPAVLYLNSATLSLAVF